jgi:Protein of unknown function (DUF4233)
MNATGSGARQPAAAAGEPRSARRQFAATMLTLEAFVAFFGALVAYGLRLAPSGLIWAVGGAVTVVCLLLAGTLRGRGAYLAGSVLQLMVLAGAVAAATRDAAGVMFLVTWAVFVALWIVALRLGGRIDRERRERADAESAEPRSTGRDAG